MLQFPKHNVSLSFLANNTDPDEMLHYAAFHLSLTVCQNTHLGVSTEDFVLFCFQRYVSNPPHGSEY